jgi:hypothetical protein
MTRKGKEKKERGFIIVVMIGPLLSRTTERASIGTARVERGASRLSLVRLVLVSVFFP